MSDLSVKIAAQHVAMRAKLNELDPLDVEDLLGRAEEVLDHGSDFYRAITGFATRYQVARHDPGQLAAEGRWLAEALEREIGMAAPSTPYRSDTDD